MEGSRAKLRLEPLSPNRKNYQTIALALSRYQPSPTYFRIEPLLNLQLKGHEHLDFFLDKLAEWNQHTLMGYRNRFKEELFKFVFQHLNTMAFKPVPMQQILLNQLYKWYQEKINPRPKLAQLFKNIKVGRSRVKETEEMSIRSTFTSDLPDTINDYQRSQFTRTMPKVYTKNQARTVNHSEGDDKFKNRRLERLKANNPGANSALRSVGVPKFKTLKFFENNGHIKSASKTQEFDYAMGLNADCNQLPIVSGLTLIRHPPSLYRDDF